MNTQEPDWDRCYEALRLRLEGKSFQSVGELMGISRQRAFQLAERASQQVAEKPKLAKRAAPDGVGKAGALKLIVTFGPGVQKPHAEKRHKEALAKKRRGAPVV